MALRYTKMGEDDRWQKTAKQLLTICAQSLRDKEQETRREREPCDCTIPFWRVTKSSNDGSIQQEQKAEVLAKQLEVD